MYGADIQHVKCIYSYLQLNEHRRGWLILRCQHFQIIESKFSVEGSFCNVVIVNQPEHVNDYFKIRYHDAEYAIMFSHAQMSKRIQGTDYMVLKTDTESKMSITWMFKNEMEKK